MTRRDDIIVVLGLVLGMLAVAHFLTGGCADTCGLDRLPRSGIRIDIVDEPSDRPMPFLSWGGDLVPEQDLWVSGEWSGGGYVARLDDWVAWGRTVEIVLTEDSAGHVVAMGGITRDSDMQPATRGVIAVDSRVLTEVTFCRFALDGYGQACGAFKIQPAQSLPNELLQEPTQSTDDGSFLKLSALGRNGERRYPRYLSLWRTRQRYDHISHNGVDLQWKSAGDVIFVDLKNIKKEAEDLYRLVIEWDNGDRSRSGEVSWEELVSGTDVIDMPERQ